MDGPGFYELSDQGSDALTTEDAQHTRYQNDHGHDGEYDQLIHTDPVDPA